LEGEAEGILGIKQAWPSTIRTVKGDHKRFEETYFAAFPVRPLRFKHTAQAKRSFS
jgi:acyl-coenzyme A synthetase/AMP-(fatty) acid ligase